MLDDILDEFTKNNIKSDVLQFGLALILSHIFIGHNFKNIKQIVLTIIGFTAFHLVITKIINTKELNPHARITIDDILKFSTMLLISKYLINKEKINNTNFILSGINLIIAFFVYNSLILTNYTYKFIKKDMSLNKILAINDACKFGFVLLFSGMLDSLLNKEGIDIDYFKLTAGYVSGLVIYDLYLV